MKRVSALMGVAILAVLAGCAKQEPPPAAQAVDEPEETAASATVAP